MPILSDADQMDGWVNEWMDGCVGGWTDGWIHGQTNGWVGHQSSAGHQRGGLEPLP